MARRTHEREAVPVDGLEGDAGRKRGGLPRGLRGDRVRVEQRGPVDRAEEREVAAGVGAGELLLGGVPLDRLAAEPEQPVLALGMLAGRVQPRQVGIRQELDSVSIRAASRPSPHCRARSAPRSHVGSWSSSGGSGASASIVAIRL